MAGFTPAMHTQRQPPPVCPLPLPLTPDPQPRHLSYSHPSGPTAGPPLMVPQLHVSIVFVSPCFVLLSFYSGLGMVVTCCGDTQLDC